MADWTNTQVSDAVRKLNPAIFGNGDPVGVKTQAPAGSSFIGDSGRYPEGKERLFQREAEQYLDSLGFTRRTTADLERNTTGLFYVHLHRCEENPYVLDLLLLDMGRSRFLEIELKADGGKVSTEQTLILRWRESTALCWNMEQFKSVVDQWRVREQDSPDKRRKAHTLTTSGSSAASNLSSK